MFNGNLKGEKFLLGIPFVFTTIFLYYVLSLAVLLGDDYYYGTFLQNGLGEFWNEVKFHYTDINGRIFVHCIAAVLLLFDTALFPLFGIVVFLLLGYYSLQFLFHEVEPLSLVVFFTFVTAFVFTLDMALLKEGIFWISAFLNYFFPVVMCIFLLVQLAEEKSKVVIFLTSFCLGATTEQMGLTSLVCVLFLYGYHRFVHKEALRVYVQGSICIFLGFATVFFSPGSVQRLGMESSGDLINIGQYLETITYFTTFLTGTYGGFYHITVFFLVFLLYLYKEQGASKLVLGAGGFVLLQVLIFLFSGSTALHLIALVLGFGSVACYFLYVKKIQYVILLGGGCGSIICTLPSSFSSPRVTLPFFVFLAIATCGIGLEILEDVPERKKNLVFSGIASGILFLSLLYYAVDHSWEGLEYNYTLDRENQQNIARHQVGEALHFNMDYDMSALHDLFLYNGFHYEKFMKYHDLSIDTKFVVSSTSDASIEIRGVTLDFPTYETEEGVYFPLELVLRGIGGYFAWTPKINYMGIGESRYIVYEEGVYHETEQYHVDNPVNLLEGDDRSDWELAFSAEGMDLDMFYVSLVKEEFLQLAFGLEFALVDGVYVLLE